MNTPHPIKSSNFTQIPNSIIGYWLPKLTVTESVILMVIYYMSVSLEMPEVSKKEMSRLTGISSKTTLNKYLSSLSRLGLIKIERRSYKGSNDSNAYFITEKCFEFELGGK